MMLPTIFVNFRGLLTSRSIPKRDEVQDRERWTILACHPETRAFCPNRPSWETVTNACDDVKERRFQRRVNRLLWVMGFSPS